MDEKRNLLLWVNRNMMKRWKTEKMEMDFISEYSKPVFIFSMREIHLKLKRKN